MSENEQTNQTVEEKKENSGKKEKLPLTKLEKILNIIGIVLVCIMTPILIMDAVLLIKSATNPNDVPSIFGSKPLVIMSDSMELNENNVENLQSIARINLKNDSFIWLNENPVNKNDLVFVKESKINEYLKEKTATQIDEVNKELVGKTIAFKFPEPNGEWSVVVHRIAQVERASTYETDSESGWILRTYGIHNESVDNWTTDPALVLGEYTGSRIKGVGSFVEFLQHWYGIVIFAGVPICAFIAYDVIVAKKRAKLEADNKTAELEAELQKLKAEKAAREAALAENEEESNN